MRVNNIYSLLFSLKKIKHIMLINIINKIIIIEVIIINNIRIKLFIK